PRPRGLRAPRADRPLEPRGVAALLVAREAPHAARSRAAARERRGRREHRGVRPPATRPRGARACGRAAPRRHLHGRRRAALAPRDDAAFRRARASPREPDPRAARDGTDLPRGLAGFGFVVPSIEQRSILACSYPSRKFDGRAPEGHELLRAFVGGALRPELVDLDDAALRAAVEADLAALLGVTARPAL